MREINLQTIEIVRNFVSDILDNQLTKNCVFHSKKHTLDVLKNVEIIGEFCELNEDDLNILRIAALLHDVGYIKTYKGHEQESAIIAEKFLQLLRLDKSKIQKVISAILATKVPQNPEDKLSEILCDADLMHLTYDNYFEQSEFMRQEWELMGIANLSPNEFHRNSINFFNSHHYHSKYGKKVLQQKKEETLKRIKAVLSD